MNDQFAANGESSAEELAREVRAIQDRVRARYPRNGAAEAKVAAIGGVNPRPPGLANTAIQGVKKAVARALNWFVRDQVEFNRGLMRCVESSLEALNETKRSLAELAAQNIAIDEKWKQRFEELNDKTARLESALQETFRREQREATDRLDEKLKAAVVETRELAEALRAQEARLAPRSEVVDLAAALRQEIGLTARDMESARGRLAEILRSQENAWSEIGGLKDTAEWMKLQLAQAQAEARELKDIRVHWHEWRQEWEKKLTTNEVQFLRSVADLQAGFQHRVSLMEANLREMTAMQHRDFSGALARANQEIQAQLWKDMEKVKAEYESLIHNELRLLRQRAQFAGPAAPVAAGAPGSSQGDWPLDWLLFAQKFRGPEANVRRSFERYVPLFAGAEGEVLDIGCGRGEFLSLLEEAGVAARGIDLNEESVRMCQAKGWKAEVADLFPHLESLPGNSLGGVFCAQVIEHLPPHRVPELVRLCAAKLKRGAAIVFETPNPECLAIFATHFYLDPTHTKPLPPALMAFYLEEAGIGRIEVTRLSPAVDSLPELASLPADVRERFFGALDYAIAGRKVS